MKVRAELLRPADDADDTVAQFLRVDRAEPHASDTASLGDHLKQPLQGHCRRQIVAVTAEMNAAENYLLEALLMQRIENLQHLTRRHAAGHPARERHDT